MNKKGSKIEKVCGRTLVEVLSAAGSSVVPVTPALFPRAAAIADVFEFYRFTKLQLRLRPGFEGVAATSSNYSYTIGYSNQTFDTAPSTEAAIIELPLAVRSSSATAYSTMMIGRKELVDDSPLKWYKTVAGTPASQFEVQGNFYVASYINATATVQLVIEWEMELSQWNLAGQSPKFAQVPGTDLYKIVPVSRDRKSAAAPVLAATIGKTE